MITSFQKKVYAICKTIPAGKVTTYKAIAQALGTKAYRAVGNALHNNPFGFSCGGDVPCHRVVASDSFLGGFAHGSGKKIALLAAEGITIKDNKIANFKHLRV